MGQIMTLGYRQPNAAYELEVFMGNQPAGIIVDIRFSPRGMRGWNQTELQAKWGKRYMHIPELGNKNYKQHGNIQIVDLDAGLERLLKGLRLGYDIVLLCACEQYATCHRKVVLEALQDACHRGYV